MNAFSDHRVYHEQQPWLLAESYSAWRGQRRLTTAYLRRMVHWYLIQNSKYGEAVRCTALVSDIARVARRCKVIVLFREPHNYLRSAWGRGVMRKGDIWDRTRLLPYEATGRAPVDQILFHFAAVNTLLAQAIQYLGPRSLAIDVRDLDEHIDRISDFIGASITNRLAVSEQLAKRLNAGPQLPWGDEKLPEPSPDAVSAAELAYRNLKSIADNG